MSLVFCNGERRGSQRANRCAIVPERLVEGKHMAESNTPISETSRARLEEMASWAGVSVAEIRERAVNEQYDRRFWDAVNAGYAALRADPSTWAEIESERRLWDNTL